MNPLRFVIAHFRRANLDAEMSTEMRAHLDVQTQRNVAVGMTLEDARAAAHRQFGGVAQIKERARDARGLVWLEQLLQDVRYAARGMLKARTFTVASVVTLALGIGVTAAMFSIIYGVLLKPYPYANSREIWAPEVTDVKTGRPGGFRLSDYHEIAQLPAVESAMATAFGTARMATDLNPEIIVAPRVTSTVFDFLGVPAMLGRGLGPVDFKPGGDPALVTVLSFRFWQRMFNGDREVLGRPLTLDDQTYAIIGVMPCREPLRQTRRSSKGWEDELEEQEKTDDAAEGDDQREARRGPAGLQANGTEEEAGDPHVGQPDHIRFGETIEHEPIDEDGDHDAGDEDEFVRHGSCFPVSALITAKAPAVDTQPLARGARGWSGLFEFRAASPRVGWSAL